MKAAVAMSQLLVVSSAVTRALTTSLPSASVVTLGCCCRDGCDGDAVSCNEGDGYGITLNGCCEFRTCLLLSILL